MKLPELQELMKQHKIPGSSYLNKPEMISRLIDKGVLTREEVDKDKRPPKVTSKDPKYDRLKHIRTHPRRTEILYLETGETVSYPSMYKAAKSIGRSSRIIAMFDGKPSYLKRYKITVYDAIGETNGEENTSDISDTSDTSGGEDKCLTCGEEEDLDEIV
jgi:hypothetical protein